MSLRETGSGPGARVSAAPDDVRADRVAAHLARRPGEADPPLPAEQPGLVLRRRPRRVDRLAVGQDRPGGDPTVRPERDRLDVRGAVAHRVEPGAVHRRVATADGVRVAGEALAATDRDRGSAVVAGHLEAPPPGVRGDALARQVAERVL